MSAFFRPFQHYSSPELLNMLLVSKLSSKQGLMKNADSLITLSSNIIGLDATSFYVGKLIGQNFSAGETIPELKSTLQRLSAINQGILIGYCAEGVKSESGMDETLKEIESTVHLCSQHENSDIAIKLTSLIPEKTLRKLNEIQEKVTPTGEYVWEESIFHNLTEKLLIDEGFTDNEVRETYNGLERIRKICKSCENAGIRVLFDAEQSYFQRAIDGITALFQKEFNKNRGVVLITTQSYLVESFDKLKGNLQWTLKNNLRVGVKIVRGAYIKEENHLAAVHGYESPIHKCKPDTDASYNNNVRLAMSNLNENSSLYIASHNRDSIYIAKDLMHEYKIHRLKGGVNFGQLLGMKAVISSSLAHNNYQVKKYCPFGPFNKLMPYMGRRAYEMLDMLNDLETQIELILQELKLRSNS